MVFSAELIPFKALITEMLDGTAVARRKQLPAAYRQRLALLALQTESSSEGGSAWNARSRAKITRSTKPRLGGLLQHVQDQVPPQPRPILVDGEGVRRSPGGLRALVPREMIKASLEGGYIENDTIRGHRALLGLAA